MRVLTRSALFASAAVLSPHTETGSSLTSFFVLAHETVEDDEVVMEETVGATGGASTEGAAEAADSNAEGNADSIKRRTDEGAAGVGGHAADDEEPKPKKPYRPGAWDLIWRQMSIAAAIMGTIYVVGKWRNGQVGRKEMYNGNCLCGGQVAEWAGWA
jgi:hypothetical protein